MLNKSTSILFVIVTLLMGLTACQKKDGYGAKGPAEQAGAQLDAAAAKAGEALNKRSEERRVGKECRL